MLLLLQQQDMVGSVTESSSQQIAACLMLRPHSRPQTATHCQTLIVSCSWKGSSNDDVAWSNTSQCLNCCVTCVVPLLCLQSASNPSCPRVNCPIAEPGQSGQPLYTTVTNTTGTFYEIRGVLSHGPLSYTTCNDWDIYTELSAANAKFLNDNRMRT